MSKERTILISSWLTAALFLFFLVPKNKLRHASVAFLFHQAITWYFGLLVVENNLIRYPRRFFKKSNKASFTFEYFIFPSIAVFFNIFYPENFRKIIKFLYYFLYLSFLTLLELIALKYTKNITYVNWKWYLSTITMGITFFISRVYYKWFFADEFDRTTSKNDFLQ